MRMRDLRVRTKLAAVLTIPLLGFLAVTGVQVASSVRTAISLDEFTREIDLGHQITALVHDLQRERDLTVGLMAAGASVPDSTSDRTFADLAPERTAVDRAVAALGAAAQPLRDDPLVDAAYHQTIASVAELGRVRQGAQSGWLRASSVFDAYTHLIVGLQTALSLPAGSTNDHDLGQAMRAAVNVARAKELTSEIRGRVYAACEAGGFDVGEFEAIVDVRAQRQAAIDRFRADADARQVTAYDDEVNGQAVRNADRLEQSVIDNSRAPNLGGVDAQQWWQASTTQLELMHAAETQLLDAALATAEARRAAQWRTTELGSLGSLLLLLVALLTSVVIGRTMVTTLHSLREQALEVAQRRLPKVIEQLRAAPKGAPTVAVEPIAVRSSDEVGEVAEAFTAVHRSAVRLAAEQALMRQNVDAIFINLARRSQALVERQLQLLDTLESYEADPDQLANLFRLDHLATRMRRNDDNLLVLAGGEATRRWSEPVALTAVVLAAAAEIEHYTRIRHDIVDDVYVAGHAVADLIHLVAELLENATIFSPPETMVNVLGWATANGGAALLIQDEGIGMSSESIGAANRQVANPVSIDVAAAERMGLVVVGHLAHRHSIGVELRAAESGVGVTVAMPSALIADPPAHPLPWSGGPARWLRTDRGAIVAGSTLLVEPLAIGSGSDSPVPPRRATPTRAEDVLGAGRGASDSVWWSRRPAGSAPSTAASGAGAAGGSSGKGPSAYGGSAATAPSGGSGTGADIATRSAPAAVSASPTASAPPAWPMPAPAHNGRNEAGLPMRVPMAQLPQQYAAPVARDTMTEPDPQEVGSTLSRFYGGIHRAALEDSDEGR
jgi:hypothetical protein